MTEAQKQATPHDQLIAEIMDSRVPKTEREWAAAQEIEQLRADAERYRRLCWLVEFGDWSVERGWGRTTYITRKENLDSMLDDPAVIAEASRIAERHSVTEEE